MPNTPADISASARSASSSAWLAAGLFFATLATLVLEVLDTRLLSVITWYHLSFLAVSVAMLGLAAGAVLVFVGGPIFSKARVRETLPRAARLLALAIAASHVTNLVLPFPASGRFGLMDLAAITISIVVLAVPFVVSGVVITLGLTRASGSIGLLYAADLTGAATGCLVVVWLLEHTDIAATAFVAASAAGAAACCFSRHTGTRARVALVLTCGLLAMAALNLQLNYGFGIDYPKNPRLWRARPQAEIEAWTAHAYVVIQHPFSGPPFLWGPGAGMPDLSVMQAWAVIDGEASTSLTAWDGNPRTLDWVKYDVTALPYQLRRGRAGVIGVGGGRDVLTALWAESPSVVGIEINRVLLQALQTRYLSFTQIASHPAVRLVHDEARSYLARTHERFDILQMSLIDTWAATGAGAFTLSENGLYTREAWRVLLDSLTPPGILSVSRWFEPGVISETTRLVSLGTAALLDRGVARPRDHLLLVTRGTVATLLISPSSFTVADAERVRAISSERQFDIVVAPWRESSDERLSRITAAASLDELAAATRHPHLDFTAPSDERPFFFNMLKPRGVFAAARDLSRSGVVAGNARATITLLVLTAIAAMLVLAIIGWPLVRAGRPPLAPRVFYSSLLYFALIGSGFMLIQIAFLQRFSVYLGHPTYTLSITLFLMIGVAGLGSLASDRISCERRPAVAALPIAIAAFTASLTFLVPAIVDATAHWMLAGRIAVVCASVAPLAFGLGFAFPLGMRLVAAHSDQVTAWMWGVNGAAGVMASIVAVGVSMWLGISANLMAAATLYALLVWPMRRLQTVNSDCGPSRRSRTRSPTQS